MSATNQSSGTLWTQVMNTVLKKNDSQKKKWRIVSNKLAECQLCSETGGGVVIRCSADKCSKEFHLDCAFHQGGLSLDDSGVLTYLCQTHFKPVLFCTCKEKYDDSQAMIFCDECCEWYHDKCVGLNPKDATRLDRYVCAHCKSILADKKPIPKALKEKNLDKEFLSSCHQAAIKSVGLLVELAGSVCVLIDDINASAQKSEYSLKEVRDAKDYLSAPPFDLSSQRQEDQADNLLEGLGVQDLVSSWRDRIAQYLNHYDQWLESARKVIGAMSTRITLSLSSNQLEVLQGVLGDLEQLETRIGASEFSVPLDMEAFFAFHDCVRWMADFLQLLHAPTKSEQWFNQLATLLKAATPKGKRLGACCKDQFCEPFFAYLQSYLKMAGQVVSEMTNWYGQACDILNQDMLFDLGDIEKFVRTADTYPTPPHLHAELTDLIARAHELDRKIELELSKPEVDEATLQRLNEQKDDMAVILPSEARLVAVDSKVIFLKAYEMALAAERLHVDVAESLCAEGAKVTQKDDSAATSVLGEHLDDRVQRAVEFLRDLMQTAKTAVDSISAGVLTGEENGSAALSTLRAQKILTVEEELLSFLLSAETLRGEVELLLTSDSSLLSNAEALLDSMEALLGNTVIEKFPVVAAHKTSLRKSHSALLDVQTTARKLWSIVGDYCQECGQGVQVSFEQFSEALNAARETHLVDEITQSEAQQLLDQAEEASQSCSQKLDSILTVSEQSLGDIQQLMTLTTHLPIKESLALRVTHRHDVFSAVFNCQKHLDEAAGESKQSDNHSFERDAAALRDLHSEVDRLSKEVAEEPEMGMLASVRDHFFLHHWCFEVRFLWKRQHSSLSSAEKLLHDGEALGSAAQQSPEWADLNVQINSARQHSISAADVLSALQQLKEETGAAVDKTLQVNINSCFIGDYATLSARVACWHQRCNALQGSLDSLLRSESTMRIVNPDMSAHLRTALDTVTLVSAAAGIVSAVSGTISGSGGAAAVHQVVDLKDVTSMANRLAVASEKDPGFQLLGDLSRQVSLFHSEASKWSEHAQNLLPQKATRNKSKLEAKTTTKQDLLEALAQPLAMAVRMPMHDKIEQTLADAAQFRSTMINFVLSPNHATSRCNYQDPEFDAKLYEDLLVLYQIKQTSELIPLDLPEFRVLGWVIDVFEWVRAVPYPGDDPKSCSITLAAAQELLVRAKPIISELSRSVVDLLVEVGLMNMDESAGPVGFNAEAHPFLKQAGELYEHLETQVRLSEATRVAVQDAVAGRKVTLELFQQLCLSISKLLVQTEPAVKRSLEKALQGVYGTSASAVDFSAEAPGERRNKVALTADEKDEDYSSDYSDEMTDSQAYLEGGMDGYYFDSASPDSKGRASKKDKAVTKRKLGEAVDLTGHGRHDLERVDSRTKDKLAKKLKVAPPRCAALDCSRDATTNSSYCSESCAANSVPEMFQALLKYRDVMCVHLCHEKLHLRDERKKLGHVSASDLEAAEVHNVDLHSAVEEITASLASKGYITGVSGVGDALDAILSKDHAEMVKVDSSALSLRVPSKVAVPEKRRGSSLQTLMGALPQVATQVFFRGDLEDAAAASTPTSSSAQKATAIKAPPTQATVDEEMRLKVRYSVEDFLMKSLARLNVPGAVAVGAILALEFEEELCQKYAFAPHPGSTRLEFDKKEYRKHHMMLMRNLKQVHNDQLILKLVSNELSFDKLFAMTAQQLADASTQIARQIQLSNAVSGNQRASTEEVLEAKRREVMTGQESWRDSSNNNLTPSASAPVVTSTENSDNKGAGGVNAGAVKSSGSSGADARLQKSRSLEIEEKVSQQSASKHPHKTESSGGSGSKPVKRSMDVDSVSRFTTGKASKLPKLEVDATAKSADPVSPKVKTPNMLDLIKSKAIGASSPTSAASKVTVSSGSALPTPSSAPSIKISEANRNTVPLINSAGALSFSINRPGGVAITCTGSVTDRRAQGLIKSSFSVQGRTKIVELERFLTELTDARKKLVIPFRLNEAEGLVGSGSGYQKFVDEFSRDLRAGMCNTSEGVQVYLIVPALQKHISVLRSLREDGQRVDNLLYGILVSKEQGPDQYVNAEPVVTTLPTRTDAHQEMEVDDPPAPVIAPKVVAPVVTPPLQQQTVISVPAPSIPAVSVPAVVPPPVRPQFVVPSKAVNAFSSQSSSASSVVNKPSEQPKPATVAPGSAQTALKTQQMQETIKKVAQFCAAKGVQTLQTLKDKEESKTLMPFLYEGQPGYPEFMAALKEFVGLANKPPSQPVPVNAERVSRFGPK